MDVTFLLHKPIVYGSALANLSFKALVAVHAVPAVLAPIASIVALATTKGKKLHIRAGKIFFWSMMFLAITGLVTDGIRLSTFFAENHTKYADAGSPSSIPARLAFLYASLCVPFLLLEGTNKRVFHKVPATPSRLTHLVPIALALIGVGFIVLVVARYNPFTGALWMIVTFIGLVLLCLRARLRHEAGVSPGIVQHRVTMSFLGAFSWWGALQGFGPWIGILVKGVDPSTTPYTGHLPGPFSPALFFFLVGWAPAFVIAALLIRRFARARATLP